LQKNQPIHFYRQIAFALFGLLMGLAILAIDSFYTLTYDFARLGSLENTELVENIAAKPVLKTIDWYKVKNSALTFYAHFQLDFFEDLNATIQLQYKTTSQQALLIPTFLECFPTILLADWMALS
jgi:hypothetical protein